MWTRAQLKERGKVSFRANYWKSVLVALVLTLIVGGGAYGISGIGSVPGASIVSDLADEYDDAGIGPVIDLDGVEIEELYDEYFWDVTEDLSDEEVAEITDKIDSLELDADGASVHIGPDGIDIAGEAGEWVHIGEDGIIAIDDGDGETHMWETNSATIAENDIAIALLVFLGLLLTLVALVIIFAIDAFLLNPLELGAKRFFLANLNRKAEVKELAFGYDHNYLNNVKTMFLRDLFTFLWGLLFIIPGIVKSYEYRMIPYIIAENPEMDYKGAFALSKQMMTGQKWNTFVLDLSFIGWYILDVITAGIVGAFYVDPYYNATCAALYENLRYGGGQPAQAYSPAMPAAAGPAPAANAADMAGQPAWATETPQAAEPIVPTAPLPVVVDPSVPAAPEAPAPEGGDTPDQQ